MADASESYYIRRAGNDRINLRLNSDEKAAILARAEELGFACINRYVLSLIKHDVDQAAEIKRKKEEQENSKRNSEAWMKLVQRMRKDVEGK